MQEGNVSVVMVSFHTGPVLWRSIESVLKQAGLHELIVVDNGNLASVQRRLSEWRHPKLHVISGHGNVGFAKGCNLGAAEALGDYLLLLNPDCILPKDTLTRSIRTFNQHPDAWVAGCRLLNPDRSEQGSCRRNILTPITALSESFQLHRFLPHMPRLNYYPPATFIPAISGAFMFMRRERYHQIGGMDEGYFLHVEDLDFCFQVQQKGGKILYMKDIEVIHYHHTSAVSSDFVERHKTRGFMRYFKKNFRLTPLLSAAIHARMALKRLTRLKPHAVDNTGALRLKLLQAPLPSQPNRDAAPVLVSGATGQLGLCVLRHLLAADIPSIALYRSTVVDFSHTQLSWHYADLNHPIDLESHQPTTLIHTAALWLLPRHIEHLANAGITRIIAFSSTSILGKASSGNPYEQAIVHRLQDAEASITAACNAHAIALTILRPTMIYGVGLDKNITGIRRFIRRFGFFPLCGGMGKRSPVHADDLAATALAIINQPATYGKTYNLGGGETLSYHDMITRVFQSLGKEPVIIHSKYLPLALDAYGVLTRKPHTNGEIARRMNSDLVFDDSAARQDFGYSPRSFYITE